MRNITDYARKSLDGLWVGDCVGNLGTLYFAHDILKALSEGVAKFGGQLSPFHKQFQYSDDTEEAIVLYNHIKGKAGFSLSPIINQDKLAMEFATRYMTRDPDGEIYGYGLNTRKVLKDIYEGTPWNEANKFMKPKAEGMPSHIDSLVNSLSTGKDMKAAMHEVNLVLERQKKGETGGQLQGSCGNGSAMRVAPLGAYLASQWSDISGAPDKNGLLPFEKYIIAEAALQSEPTHCHPEGIAGAIAITSLTYDVTTAAIHGDVFDRNKVYESLLRRVPEGIVRQGIIKAQALPYETPIGKAIEILGNGTHVTCQDTVPLCCWLAIKHLDLTGKDPETYEKAIIETSMAFGDVDTNCAIVGGMVGVVCPPPAKWTQFCEPMEGVV
jgi:ADP-ribosylglycohydrolase